MWSKKKKKIRENIFNLWITTYVLVLYKSEDFLRQNSNWVITGIGENQLSDTYVLLDKQRMFQYYLSMHYHG